MTDLAPLPPSMTGTELIVYVNGLISRMNAVGGTDMPLIPLPSPWEDVRPAIDAIEDRLARWEALGPEMADVLFAYQDGQDATDLAVSALVADPTDTRAAVESVAGAAAAAAVAPIAPDGDVRAVGKGELGLRATDAGVPADGVTSANTTLAAAASSAATFGVPLILEDSATYALTSTLDLPAGLILETRGAVFKGPTSMNAAVVRIVADDVTVRGTLRVECGTGVVNRGLMVSGAARARLGDVRVTAPTAGTGWGSNGLQTGLSVVGCTDVRMGRVAVSGYDYAVTVDGSTGVVIDHLSITSYVRGLYITDSNGVVQVRGGLFSTASPNSAVDPGHNGVLISSSTAADSAQDITLRDVVVRDAGEHGIRVGGDFRSSRIYFDHCTVVNAGSAGFKVLGNAPTGSFTENLTFTNCIAEDCGILSTSCGFLIEKTVGVTLISPVVRKRNKNYSAYTGIKSRGNTDLTITDPLIYDTALACIHFEPGQGNQTDCVVRGGKLSASMGHGVIIDYTGVTYRRVNVLDFPVMNIGGTGFAVSVTSGGGTITGGPALLQMICPIASDRIATGQYGVYMAEIHASAALPASTLQFKNGSTWVDHGAGTRHMRVAGTWTAQ